MEVVEQNDFDRLIGFFSDASRGGYHVFRYDESEIAHSYHPDVTFCVL